MGYENGTKWLTVRSSIKRNLLKYDFIEPFTIEDYATEIPSTQFFSWQVSQTDVIVILIKGEIRLGTKQEIEIALKEGKPLLVYFESLSSPNEAVKEFEDNLISQDRTTFKRVENFDDIDRVVLNDVINNLVSYYKFSHEIVEREEKDSHLMYEMLSEEIISDKNFLSSFGNNRNALIDTLSIQKYASQLNQENVENSVGMKLINWLCNGDDFISEKEIIPVWEDLSLSDNIIEILHLRHKSVQKYLNDEIEEALLSLDKSYDLATEYKLPNWLVGDILIDSRNINSKLNMFNNKYQNKIKNFNYQIHFPVGDRLIKEAYEILEKERITISTLPASSVRFGNTLIESLEKVEHYLYASAIVSSSTHLLLARKKMIDLLLEYGDIYDDYDLIYTSLKLIIIAGEEKMFKQVLDKYWSEINYVIAANVEHVWLLTEQKYCINKKNMKLLIIKSLGQYMNNSLFRTSTIFLSQCSQEIKTPEEAMVLIDSINHNLYRINNDFVLDMITKILQSDKVLMFDKVAKILSGIDLSNCDELDIVKLNDLLKTKIDTILSNNGNPYFIINLLQQRKDKFEELYNILITNISDDQIDHIDIQLGNIEKADIILKNSIIELEKRFESNSKGRVTYRNNPLVVIVEIIKKYKTKDLTCFLNQNFFPLAIKVLSNDVSLKTKESYLEILVTLLVEYKKQKQDLPLEIKEYFLSNEIELTNEISFEKSSVVSAVYYISTIKSLLRIDTENDIFLSCVGYKSKTRIERGAFSYSIQKYIEFNIISKRDIPLFINLVVLEMLRDHYFVVRKNGLRCLILLYNYNPTELIRRELIRLTLDSSPNVKGYYIALLKEGILNEDFAKELLDLFSKDASYNIREASLGTSR